jgi:glycosyltransferase involved in cell wall biosynthesis
MELVISIPTYWGRKEGWKEGDIIFDHPTPLEQEGTIKRAVESLSILDNKDFRLIIIVSATTPDIYEEAGMAVNNLFPDLDLESRPTLATYKCVKAIRELLTNQGHTDLCDLVSLKGYSDIRNFQLICTKLLGGDTAVYLDDDEVIEDPGFLKKVITNRQNGYVGFAGYYIDADGGYLITSNNNKWEEYWSKRESMNTALKEVIDGPPGIKKTNFAFGGNMVIASELFNKVPFDPLITRGEDIDFIINTRFSGYDFFLDNKLAIRHLPPQHPQPEWRKLRVDIQRFIYERDKVTQAGLNADQFDPFPGNLLKDDLKENAIKTFDLLAAEYRNKGDLKAANSTLEAGNYIANLSYPNAYEDFINFQDKWQRLMKIIEQDEYRAAFLSSIQ